MKNLLRFLPLTSVSIAFIVFYFQPNDSVKSLLSEAIKLCVWQRTKPTSDYGRRLIVPCVFDANVPLVKNACRQRRHTNSNYCMWCLHNHERFPVLCNARKHTSPAIASVQTSLHIIISRAPKVIHFHWYLRVAQQQLNLISCAPSVFPFLLRALHE